MATYSKLTLQPTSGTSTSGIPIIVAGITSGSPTTIHTTQNSATAFDEVWLYATNTLSAAVVLTIQYGGSSTVNQIQQTIPANSGLTLVIPGLILAGTGSAGNTITAYAGTTNVINISGYVNRIQ
jgi:hypothetical protein